MQTTWNTIFIQSVASSFHGQFDSERNKGLVESGVSEKGFIDFDGIKGDIPKKRFWLNQRVFPEKSIMSINVHLLYCLIGSSMSWHGSVSCFVRIIGVIKVMEFFESIQLLDNTVGIFRVVFCNPCFNTRGIKDCHGSKSRIKFLADQFGQINKIYFNNKKCRIYAGSGVSQVPKYIICKIGGNYMLKKIRCWVSKCTIANAVATFALIMGIISANSCCVFVYHQPQIPDDLKTLRKF